MKRLDLSILVFISLISMCMDCGRQPIYYLDDDFKDYAIHPTGSFWVYEEVTSRAIDTLKILSSEHRIDNGGIDHVGFESYEQIIFSSLLNEPISAKGAPSTNNREISVYYEIYLSYSSQPFGSEFETRLKPDSRIITTLTFKEFLDSETVLSNVFHDVKVFGHKVEVVPGQVKRTFYSRNVGMIKKEMFNGEIWQLKSFFINE